MPLIATDTVGLSNLVKREHPWMESDGYGIVVTASTAVMGQVVKNTAGTWAAITNVPLATDEIGVVLDATKEDATKKRILVKGETILGAHALVYFSGATAGNIAAVNALLEAKNIQINTAV